MGLYFRHTTNLGGGNRVTTSKRLDGSWLKYVAYLIFLPVVLLVLLWRGLSKSYGTKTALIVFSCLFAAVLIGGSLISIFGGGTSAPAEAPAVMQAEEPAPQTPEEITPTAEEAPSRSLPVAAPKATSKSTPAKKPEQKPAETDQTPAETDQTPAETEQKPAEAPALKEGEATVWIAASREGDRYHRENCRWIKDGKIEISLSEAEKAGFTPCKTCKP